MTNSDQRLIDNFFSVLHAMAVETQPLLTKEDFYLLRQNAPDIFSKFSFLMPGFRKVVNSQLSWTREHYKNRHLKKRIEDQPYSIEQKKKIFKNYMREDDFISIPIVLTTSDGTPYFEDLSVCLTKFLSKEITLANIMDDQKWKQIEGLLAQKVEEPFRYEEGAGDLTPGCFMFFTQRNENAFSALLMKKTLQKIITLKEKITLGGKTILQKHMAFKKKSRLQKLIALKQIMDDQKWLEIKKLVEENKANDSLYLTEGATDLTPGRFMPFLQKDEKDFAALVHDAEREVSPQEEVPHLSSQRCSVSVR